MAKVISQETFDDVVKENIVEFSMSTEEAKKETIEQFEAQGINLANIIKDLAINEETGRPVLNETLENLKELSVQPLKHEEINKHLITLATECAKSVPHRVVSGLVFSLCELRESLTESLFDHRWQRITTR